MNAQIQEIQIPVAYRYTENNNLREQSVTSWQQINDIGILYIISSIAAVILIWGLLTVNGLLSNVLVWVLNVGVGNVIWSIFLNLGNALMDVFSFVAYVWIGVVIYRKITGK